MSETMLSWPRHGIRVSHRDDEPTALMQTAAHHENEPHHQPLASRSAFRLTQGRDAFIARQIHHTVHNDEGQPMRFILLVYA